MELIFQISKNTKVCNVYGHEIPIAEYCIATILSWEMQLIKKIILKNLTGKIV